MWIKTNAAKMSSAKINLTQIHSALINSFRVGLFHRSKSEMYQDIPGSFPSDLKANEVTVRKILTFLDLLLFISIVFFNLRVEYA